MEWRSLFNFCGVAILQQLSIKRTTIKPLKALLCNTFKAFISLGLSAKRCNVMLDVTRLRETSEGQVCKYAFGTYRVSPKHGQNHRCPF